MEIAGSVALVTGGASGLGQATAGLLTEAGAEVVVADLPDCDVRDEDQVQAMVDRASALGDLRIVVNCAGVGFPGRVVSKRGPLPLDQFATVVDINLVGTFNVIRLAVARMLHCELVGEERGVVVNTASIAAFDGQVGQAAYAASKGGVAGMTLPLARDLADKHVRVVTIAPGTFDTPMLAGLPGEVRDALAAQIPHPPRLGRPAEFAALVRHIVENPLLNGEVIRLDGALRMPPR